MSRTHLIAFLKDEKASVAMEYLLLIGVLGMIWLPAAAEYRDRVTQMYHDISRQLSHIRF